MSYQQRTRFQTTLDFDREYLTSGKRRYQLRRFSTFNKNNLNYFDPLTKNDLSRMTLKFSGFLEVVKVHVRAKFHQAKCSGS